MRNELSGKTRIKLAIPVIAGIIRILHHDGAFRRVGTAGSLDFVLLSRREGHKGGEIEVVVPEGVEFDAALGVPRRKQAREKPPAG